MLISPLLLQPFQPDQPITVTWDASQHGIAATLEQNGRPVLAISKILSAAERKYSLIEREALSIVWTVKKLSKFLLHKKFTRITDHKPLLYIFNKTKPINAITASRLQRWALTLMAYNFDIKYSRSEYMHLADLLSRCGTLGGDESDLDINMLWQSPMAEIQQKLKQIMARGKWEILKGYIIKEFPRVMDARLLGFLNVKDSLTIHDDLIYKCSCLVIPEELCHIVQNEIYRDHLGI